MKFTLFVLFFSCSLLSQTQYPKNYFSPPIDIPMQLSGNFGELRPNHFHAGFDIKTMQKEGLSIYAVADGYVSRIKISTFGNGKTIYITHPNGYTSVYGHLQKTSDSIEKYIKAIHYKEQSFEIEAFLKPNELVVKQGQLIALSGNTGASEGPHLHFEFRDTQTENIINPLLMGFDTYFTDTKKPVISNLYVYPIDAKTTVNKSKRPVIINLSLQKDGTYISDKVVANGPIGFGVVASDYDNVSFNKNGVYKVRSFINGQANFEYQFDTYSFEEMRYINALIDYSFYKKTQQRIQKLFMKKPFPLSILKSNESNGIITVTPNLSSIGRIEVADFYGNTTVITIPIQYDTLPATIHSESVASNYFVKAGKENLFAKENISVLFPEATFYDDFQINFDVKNGVLFLHEDTVPIHSNFTITIEDQIYSGMDREKVFIGRINGSKISYNSTYTTPTAFTAKARTLGQYKLVMDTISPKVSLVKPIEGKWISDQKTLQLMISDESSGIKTYMGYLNGNWALFEYDNKTKKITHTFSDGIVAEGRNDLKVVVTDNVGNSTTFETHFFRSQKK